MTSRAPATTQSDSAPLRILMELRPALDRYAGIPQATRLLFRGLGRLENVQIEGLLQTAGLVLPAGLPVRERSWRRPLTRDQQLNRLGRVVIKMEQKTRGWYLTAVAYTVAMACRRLLGGREQLTRFEALHFRDFLWRRFFAKTLLAGDFDLVTRCGFRIARVPYHAMHICAVLTRQFGYALYPRFATSDFDVMICETPFPGTVAPTTRLVIHYHDAVPLLMPHTIADRRFHQAAHYNALRNNVANGAWFVCASDATRRDLISVFPQAEPRSVTIHNMISQHFNSAPSELRQVPEIIRTRLNLRLEPPLDAGVRQRLIQQYQHNDQMNYLLVVSTIEPRKNHLTLLAAWEQLRTQRFADLKLVMVGSLGWHHDPIIDKFRPALERTDVVLLEDVLAEELRVLYAHAKATICPSFGEGFDFSGVEAMKSGGAVVASDISVHHEVFADAAEYFNPYAVESLTRAILNVIDPAQEARRLELITRGAVVAERYDQDVILPKWGEFLRPRAGLAPEPNS
jgi:glycosyltransferase involved in cell wall biosynthesis